MNFQSLKWMIDTLVKTFNCPECNSEVNDSSVDIMWAAGSTINIDIMCPNCWKHSMVKTEVLAIDLSAKGISAENIEKLKKSLMSWNSKMDINVSKIKDDEIKGLNNDLNKDDLNVSDLFWEQKD